MTKQSKEKQPIKTISLKIPVILLEQVQERARENFTSVSGIIKQALVEFLGK